MTIEEYLIIGFSIFITAVFIAGLLIRRQARMQLIAEEADLRTLRSNLDQMQSGAVNDLRLGLENVDGVVRQRVETVLDIKDRNGRIDLDALSQVAEARLTRHNSFVKYIAGTLILIGLLGTLSGLIVAVNGLSEVLKQPQNHAQSPAASAPADDTKYLEGIQNQLTVTLTGMRVAFVASLFGVGTTIALTFMLSFLTRRQEKFLADLEEITTRFLTPIYFPQEQTRSLDQFAGAMAQTGKLLERLAGKLKTDAAKSEQSFNQLTTLVTGFNRFTENFQTSHETVQNKLINQIDKLASIIRLMDESTNKTVATVSEMTAMTTSTLEKVQASLEQFRDDMARNAKVFENTTKDFFERQLKGVFFQSLESFDGAVKLMKSTNDELLKQVGDLQQQQSKATEALLLVRNYFHEDDRLGQMRDAIVASTKSVEERVTETLNSERQQAAAIIAIQELLTNGAAASQQTMQEQNKAVQEFLAKAGDNQTALQELVKQFLTAPPSNGRPAEGAAFAAPAEETTALLREIAQQLQAVNQALSQPTDEEPVWRKLWRRLV